MSVRSFASGGVRRSALAGMALVMVPSVGGCSKSEPAAALEAGASAPVVAVHEAASAPSASAPAAVATSSFTGPLRGTLDGKHAIVMHLTNSGGALAGTYYYVPSIDDLDLRGSVSATGDVHLDESNKGKATGSFDGHLDARDSFAGTWSDPAKTRSLPFHLELARSPANAPVLVVERKRKAKSKPTGTFDPSSWGTEPVCDLDVAFPDVLGGFLEPAREAKLDQELRSAALDALLPCEEPFTLGASYKVVTNAAGVLSVEQPTSVFNLGMPHPSYGSTFTNLAVPSGQAIALKDILTPEGIKLIGSRILAHVGTDVDDTTRTMIADTLAASPPDFSLVKAGLRAFLFNQLPHADQGAGVDGLLVPAKDLAGVRKRPSPVDALWGP